MSSYEEIQQNTENEALKTEVSMLNDAHMVQFIREALIPEIWLCKKISRRKMYHELYEFWCAKKYSAQTYDDILPMQDFFTRLDALIMPCAKHYPPLYASASVKKAPRALRERDDSFAADGYSSHESVSYCICAEETTGSNGDRCYTFTKTPQDIESLFIDWDSRKWGFDAIEYLQEHKASLELTRSAILQAELENEVAVYRKKREEKRMAHENAKNSMSTVNNQQL